jgi:hypothetical protein
MSGTDEVAATIRALRSDGDLGSAWPSSPGGPEARWHGPPPARPPRPGVVASAFAVFGPLLVWIVGSTLAAASLQPVRSDDECVGFCTTPREGAIHVALYAGIFVVPVATLVSWVAAALVEPERRAGVVTWVLIADAMAMAVLVALFVGEVPSSDRVGG